MPYAALLLFGAAQAIAAQVHLPGTSSVSVGLAPPFACRQCHGEFEPTAPWETWAGSVMGHAAQDPLFFAQLTEVEKDAPGIGDLCLRCHAPAAWLEGRCAPTDGSALTADDPGVTCAFCHRMDTSPWRGDGQYQVGDDLDYRGARADAAPPHHKRYSEWLKSSEMCAACHELWNPFVEEKTVDGRPTGQRFFEQTTYTEWASSAYASGVEKKSCQDCHMPRDEGRLAMEGPVRIDRAGHGFPGGNLFLLGAIAFLEPGLGLADQLAAGETRIATSLRSAASLELIGPAPTLARGRPVRITYRVTNLTGHKLPTGYPDGRRVWLSVRAPELALDRGRFDAASGEPVDPVATYRTLQGQHGIGPGHRLVLNDTVFEDTRLPPKGLRVSALTDPVGKIYPEVAPGILAHWDDVVVTATVPCDLAGPTVTLSASLWYQGVTRALVDALVAENGAAPTALRLAAAFDEADPGPFEMVSLDLALDVDPASSCTPPDAGVSAPDAAEDASMIVDASAPVDAGVRDAMGVMASDEGGCACSAAREASGGGDAMFALGLAALVSAVRRSPRRRNG